MTKADRDKNAADKPHAFQNGFVANRIARGEAGNYPGAEIDVVPVKYGKGRVFVIRKLEAGVETYWINPATGFLPLPGAGDVPAR